MRCVFSDVFSGCSLSVFSDVFSEVFSGCSLGVFSDEEVDADDDGK